jgi:hypothetical protein
LLLGHKDTATSGGNRNGLQAALAGLAKGFQGGCAPGLG